MVETLSVQDFQANIKLYWSFTKAAADQLLHLADSYPSFKEFNQGWLQALIN